VNADKKYGCLEVAHEFLASLKNFANSRPTGNPMSWAATNPAADDGFMPVIVSVKIRAMVTAGLANVVDEVK
jgi:hypothetical protein